MRTYGEAEFWLSGGKLILILLLFAFTFITMVGGNPQHDAYGFRHFKNPASFAEYMTTGDLGRFEGFLAALSSAAFTIIGPEFISMVAAEALRPSLYVKAAFKTVYARLCVFFIVGALAVGIVVPYNHPVLVETYFGDGKKAGTSAASPYVIAMEALGIDVLPHIVNALVLTSIFSAGNTYCYCATRVLHGLALDGRAPHFLRYCTKSGVPIYCFFITILFSFLSLLQLSSSSAEVLTMLINLSTGGTLITFLVMSITFVNYYKGCVAQGVDRKTRPYYGYFQPYGAYIAIFVQGTILMTYGYRSFRPWSASKFFANYTLQLVAPCLFIGWKVVKKTRYVRPHEMDLTWERPLIDAYEDTIETPPTGFWEEMGHMVGIRRSKKDLKA